MSQDILHLGQQLRQGSSIGGLLDSPAAAQKALLESGALPRCATLEWVSNALFLLRWKIGRMLHAAGIEADAACLPDRVVEESLRRR